MFYAFIAVFSLLLLFVARIVIQNRRFPVHLGYGQSGFSELDGKPNWVSSQTQHRNKRVAPLPFKGSLSDTQEAVRTALTQLGGNEILSQTDSFWHVVFTTPTLRFHDDLELYFDQDTALIQYRSKSRSGTSDLGLNRRRYEAFSSIYTAL
ncbi:DUF1499 domain-containing protein [Pseudovibrio exalbescens]|uniref:DUF1499 domain-containing protein n=1 Tax=Pseudovibrio exalbescens TaxID=197461 RepID=UPI00236608A9|nr:DUF1499 domain-containing protein [Pseudovibrio exalbescens]MDD7909726.1 DUF1499 domain-containing protein [Pseudovibrio exalbescens]